MTNAVQKALLRCRSALRCTMCGKEKQSTWAFCRTCYFALQPPIRNSLYVRADEPEHEFYDNYLRAMAMLKNKGLYVLRTKLPAETRRILQDTGLAEAMRRSKR